MAATAFEGPRACPFVALELDRDRRSERPDYRHRCFAEPTPAPRSIAHQEAYCLSPGFSACPIFQDWALRAAARPVGTPAPLGATAVDPGGQAEASFDDIAAASSQSPIEDELPPLPPLQASEPEPVPEPEPEELKPLPNEAYAPPNRSDWDDVGQAQQLGAFDDSPSQPSLPGALTAPEPEPDYDEPPELAPQAGYVPPPARRDDPTPLVEEAAVPAFLAGRATAPRPTGPLPLTQPVERVSREEIVPSWELDSRYGAEAGEEPGGGNRFDSVLTAIAVIVILALGVAGVLFLPGLLAGTPDRSPRPSITLPSGEPSAQPSLGATAAATLAPATTAPTADPTLSATTEPGASPRFYRIRSGDTLAKVARRFDITVGELLAANPEITDPNRIFVGQVIVIPQPSGTDG